MERALDRDPARTEALSESLATALEPLVGLRVGAHLQALRPLVVAPRRATRVAKAVERTAREIARALSDEAAVASLPGLTTALLDAPPPPRADADFDLLRPDGALFDDGRYALMELNAGSCVGGLVEIERIGEVMARWYGDAIPLRWPRPATDLARALRRRYGRGARCAWVVGPGRLGRNDGIAELGEAFSRVMRAEGMSCEPVESDALAYDGRAVRHAGARVHALVRLITPLDWWLRDAYAQLRDAVAAGHVQLFSGPYDLMLNHKGALALLSRAGYDDPQGASIPWTRFARPAMEHGEDLLPMVLGRAEDHVLKPCIDLQGQRVVPGREAGPRWRQHLVAAVLADDCIVQRWVEPPRATLPFRVEGALTRTEVSVVASSVVVRGAAGTLCARTSVPDATLVLTHPYAGTTGLLPVVEPAA